MDDLFGIDRWPGVAAAYSVARANAGLRLQVAFTFDPAAIPDAAYAARAVASGAYARICDQFGVFDPLCALTTPSLVVEVDTAGTLARAPMSEDAGGRPIVDLLGGFLCQVRAWIDVKPGARADSIPHLTLSLPLERDYPLLWSGDLQELAVQLVLTTARELAPTAPPAARRVTSRIGPRLESGSAGSALSAFAKNLEDAYDRYDGGGGCVKIAAGGDASVWALRLGAEHGVAISVQEQRNDPSCFALPPLSPVLMTRQIGGASPGEPSHIFSDVDLEVWARAFLESLEGIFSSDVLPHLGAGGDVDYCARFLAAKAAVAAAIAGTIVDVDETPDPTADQASALETLRLALLDSLAVYARVSTYAQLGVRVSVHGVVEPAHIAGPVVSSAPPSLVPAMGRLAVGDGDTSLNVPIAPADPAAQRVVDLRATLALERVEMGGDESRPTGPLTFVLPRAGREPNLLAVALGRMLVRLPLRACPLGPILGLAAAAHDAPPEPIVSLADGLTWRYSIGIARPAAAQDTLHVRIAFNEPAADRRAAPSPTDQPMAGDLFDALARYVLEFPQLGPQIARLAGGRDSSTDAALARFLEIAEGIAAAWRQWQPSAPAEPPVPAHARETSLYDIDQDDDGARLRVTMTATGAAARARWPEIQGYVRQAAAEPASTVYAATEPVAPADLVFTWTALAAFGQQTARTEAWIERNRNLAATHRAPSARLVSRSAVRSSATSAAPPIETITPIAVPALASIDAALTALLRELRTVVDPPGAGVGTRALQIDCRMSYSYALGGSGLRTSLAVAIVNHTIESGEESHLAAALALTASEWKSRVDPPLDGAAVALDLTVFATTLGGSLSPVVHLAQLEIAVPPDPVWWRVAT